MKRDSFIFYRSFFEASKHLTTEQKSDLFTAICRYSLDNEEMQLDDMCSAMFSLIKPQLQANYKRWQNGCKKKQTISKPEAKQKQKRSKQQANVNVNDNVNVNVNERVYRKFSHLQINFDDYETLIIEYDRQKVDDILDQIENFAGNKKYKNLYLTAKNWLKRDAKNDTEKKRVSDFNAQRAFGVSL